jgi:hypothetical protein
VERVGRGSATLRRWLKLPEFTTELDRRINEGRTEALRSLRTLNGEAVNTIAELMRDTEPPAHVRLQAALKVLELGVSPASEGDNKGIIMEEKLKYIRETVYGIYDDDEDKEAVMSVQPIVDRVF